MITNSLTKIIVSLTISAIFLFAIWYWKNPAVDNAVEVSVKELETQSKPKATENLENDNEYNEPIHKPTDELTAADLISLLNSECHDCDPQETRILSVSNNKAINKTAISNSKDKANIQTQQVSKNHAQDDRCAIDAEVLRVQNGVFECSVDSHGNAIRWILQGYDD